MTLTSCTSLLGRYLRRSALPCQSDLPPQTTKREGSSSMADSKIVCSLDGCESAVESLGLAVSIISDLAVLVLQTFHPEAIPCPTMTSRARSRTVIDRPNVGGMCNTHYMRAHKIGLPPLDHDPIKEFWERLDKSGGPTACWPWNGPFDDWGDSGQCDESCNRDPWRTSSLVDAYKWSYPVRLVGFRHTCDNLPPCCNPDHLWLGTDADNKMDCMSKGRDKHLRPESGTRIANSPK